MGREKFWNAQSRLATQGFVGVWAPLKYGKIWRKSEQIRKNVNCEDKKIKKSEHNQDKY